MEHPFGMKGPTMITRKPPPGGPQLVIKESTSIVVVPCGICGQPTSPFAGPELFRADTQELACWDCGQTYGADFVAMLESFWVVVAALADEADKPRITPAA